jgi:hypothetical protein
MLTGAALVQDHAGLIALRSFRNSLIQFESSLVCRADLYFRRLLALSSTRAPRYQLYVIVKILRDSLQIAAIRTFLLGYR